MVRGGQPGGQQLTCKSRCSVGSERRKDEEELSFVKVLTIISALSVKYLVQCFKQRQNYTADRKSVLNPD